jgi:salicylate hydroxylase/6-hydroxynicotinate 3-monooxygenase
MGGLATAAALRRVEIEVTVYEQARHFSRIGAGIQIGCNAMKVLRAFGLEPPLRAAAFYPRSWNNKDYDTGDVRFDMIFGEAAEERYGAPYLLAHRGDLHAALASVVPKSDLRLDHQLTRGRQRQAPLCQRHDGRCRRRDRRRRCSFCSQGRIVRKG